jgi:hypothetical protein
MRRTFAAMALLAAIAAIAAVRVGAQTPDLDPDVRSVLTRYFRFSTSELSDLLHDRTVKHILDSQTPGEFGAAGATRIHASKAGFVAALRDIVHFKTGPGVLQIGRFSDPPSLDDLAGLTVDKDDFDPTTCRLHDCGIRLPAEWIRRLQHDIDPGAPNAQAQAAAWFKRALLTHVTGYVTGGPGRFVQYDDGESPIRPVEQFEGVLAHMPAIGALVPGLPDHLARFPERRLAAAEDFLYWSKEKFGIAPFISVTHVTIVCPPARTCVTTTKDVYSSRYIDASLALAIASDAAAGDAFYLVYANRARANALKGRLSGLRHSIVERRARAALDENLKTIKIRLEKGR